MVQTGDGPYGSSFTEWFDWIKSQKLRTYFNDHPFPVAARGEVSRVQADYGLFAYNP